MGFAEYAEYDGLGLAALAAGRVRPPSRVAVVISGGNIDLSLLCN